MDKTTQATLYRDFLTQLERECMLHYDFNSSGHRYKMSQLGLNTLKKMESPPSILDFINVTEQAEAAVLEQLDKSDHVQLKEIMETLRVVARYTFLQFARRGETEANEHILKVLKSVNTPINVGIFKRNGNSFED